MRCSVRIRASILPNGRPLTANLVSIITPTYNASRWIIESMRSALAQSYPQIEFLLIDNGSTDDTVERARAVADERVRIMHEPARGPSAARNAGLAAARGSFIQFLDADDALDQGKIERQVALLEASGAGVAWGPFVRAADDGRPLTSHATAVIAPNIDDDVEASLLGADGFVHLGATLLRRSAIGGTRFDEAVRVVEDVRFLIAVAASGAQFVGSSERSGYFMREHDDARRASRVDRAIFWRSCYDLAADTEARWRSHGTITARRARTLAHVFVGAARNLVQTDRALASAAIDHARALMPEYHTLFPPRWRSLVRAIGFERAEDLVAMLRRLRRRPTA